MGLVYVVLISGTLCAAGLAGDLMRSVSRRSARGVWLFVLIVSSLGPIAVMRWAQHEPAAFEYQRVSLPSQLLSKRVDEESLAGGGGQEAAAAVPNDSAATARLPTNAAGDGAPHWSLNRLVAGTWLVLSGGAMIVIALASLIVTRRARYWTAGQLEGIPVRISDDVGPAVVGILRPYIVVPRWLLAKSAAVQNAAVTHELEHLRARDPALWRLGLVLGALTPWNPLLWWQLRRLRFAIERDCDQRVLRQGIERAQYGRALLDIAQSQVASPFGAIALTEGASQLERRVRAILSRPRSYAHRVVWAALAGAAMVGCIALAAEVRPPGVRDPGTLRFPPMEDRSSFWLMAKAVAKKRYPALFAGRFTGTTLVTVELSYDGTVVATRTQEFPPGPLAGLLGSGPRNNVDPSLFDRMADWRNESVPVPQQGEYHFLGWFGARRSNGLYIRYYVLKWPPDPDRNTETAERAVATRYPDYFRSYPAGNDDFRTVRTLSVLLDDSGAIARERWGTDDVSAVSDAITRDAVILSHFRVMGLAPASLAHWGEFANFQWHMHAYKHVPPLRVFYAWRRSNHDPVLNEDLLRRVEIAGQRSLPSWESTNEHAIRLVEFYFPDVWAHGTSPPKQMVWFLLDKSGKVIDHGYGNDDNNGTTLHSPQRHPGIRIGDFVNAGVETMSGQAVRAGFEWLRADSPPP